MSRKRAPLSFAEVPVCLSSVLLHEILCHLVILQDDWASYYRYSSREILLHIIANH